VSGQPTAEGATVAAGWLDRDAMKVTVTGDDEELEVDTFRATIGVARSDKTFWGSAEAVAGL
jgi:hypothetical protein